MEEIKILLYALASFLSSENPPILAKSAKIEINMATKQIVLHQNDIITVPQYADKASAALEEVLKTQAFVKDLEPLVLTSKHFYEDDGKLNASIYFQFKEMSDLRAISMYFNAEENTLSYPFVDSFEYTALDAVFDDRYVRFKADGDVNFHMAMKATPELENTVSLLSNWKRVEQERFIDVSDTFSKDDFERLRKFIFKKGDRRSFRNFDNNNPHYRFDDFDVYLATGDQRSVFENRKLKPEDYTELVIGFSGSFSLFLTGEKQQGNKSQLKPGNVYWHNRTYRDQAPIEKYLTAIKSALK